MGQDEQDPGLRAVESLHKLMLIDEEWSVRRPRGFTWWAYRLAQHVEAGKPFRQTEDGPTASLIRIWTDVVTEVPSQAAAEALDCTAMANPTETMSALVFDESAGTITECCTVIVTDETNEQWLKVLSVAAVMQNTAAHSRAHSVANAVAGKPAQSAHPTNGERPEMDGLLNYVAATLLPSAPKESAFAGELIKSLTNANLPFWTLANGDANGFTGEIPFSGNVPAVALKDRSGGPQTALFQVFTNDSHPELGSGALIVLKLPTPVEDDAKWLANSLNLLESSGQGLDTQLGAWCIVPNELHPLQAVYQGVARDQEPRTIDLAFVTFVPSQLAWGNVLQNLAKYDYVRTRWAFGQLNRAEGEPTKPSATPTGSGAPCEQPESVAQQADLEWSRFSQALASCLAQLEAGSFVILPVSRHITRYVQFAQHGPAGLLGESVSNRNLEDFELDSGAQARLVELGWAPPADEQGGGSKGTPNWHKEWEPPVPYSAVADLAVDTLRSVYKVAVPADLSYMASDRSGAELSLPDLGIHSMPRPSPPSAQDDQDRPDVPTSTGQTPAGKANVTSQIGPDNVGWILWHMSQRISSVKVLALRTRELLDDKRSAGDWLPEDLAELARIADDTEKAAQGADALWKLLCAAASNTDRTLAEPTEQGISIIHNHGTDPATMAMIWPAWNSDTSVHDGKRLSDELDALVTKHGLPAIRAVGTVSVPGVGTSHVTVKSKAGDCIEALSLLELADVPALEENYLALLVPVIRDVQHKRPYTTDDAYRVLDCQLQAILTCHGQRPDREPPSTNELDTFRAALIPSAHSYAARGEAGVNLLLSQLLPAALGELGNNRGDLLKQLQGVFSWTLLGLCQDAHPGDPVMEPFLGIAQAFAGWSVILNLRAQTWGW